MQQDDRSRRRRFAVTRQRGGALVLLVALFALVAAARSGRYDAGVDRAARRLEAGVQHVTGFVRRHLGG
ncbi:hypothetical protein [Cognatilysobacter segetis]|uniref:hypothetical protein n=1 Tax=Cognatilysobacter segetis TaxID=2492394 RepID=UPI001061F0EC|nr:hypothetical protein [Lysobacter segetis]